MFSGVVIQQTVGNKISEYTLYSIISGILFGICMLTDLYYGEVNYYNN
jgi:hypothetical protein